MAGATVIVTTTDRSPLTIAGRTVTEGRFHISNLPPGEYDVVFVYGHERDIHTKVAVSEGATTPIRGQLPLGEPEIITVHEHVPVEQPKPIRSTVKRVLPYSDEAVDTDTWAVGWLLLDLDPAGKVVSFRFLHRPGRGLDDIARNEVWGLRFDPARDAAGKAVPSQVLWKMEWPSYWWRVEIAGFISASPGFGRAAAGLLRRGGSNGNLAEVRFLLPLKARDILPPCRGTAPLNLDSAHPVHRDCSVPEYGKLDTEPVIGRPPGK